MEVDMLMQDLLPHLEEAIPASPTSPLGDKIGHFTEHQEALADQREKVTGEADSLLEHVQNMHSGFVNMKNGLKPRTHRTRYGHMKTSTSMPKELHLPLNRPPSSSSLLHSRTPMVY